MPPFKNYLLQKKSLTKLAGPTSINKYKSAFSLGRSAGSGSGSSSSSSSSRRRRRRSCFEGVIFSVLRGEYA